MRTRAALGGIFASVAILVIGWQAGDAVQASNSSGSSGSSAGKTYTGDVESTQFGTVQVSIDVAGGTITDVTALKLTDDGGRSVQISEQAAPILRSEVLASQSAKVATVSGATYTSDAYLSSLQSAIDKAGL
ncbi:hypothetical protein BH09ACT1_BH09ACT1_16940 [soil metagenome]